MTRRTENKPTKRKKSIGVSRIKRINRRSCKGLLTPEIIEETEMLIGKLGFTRKHLAEYFDINTTTLEMWERKNPEFKKALRRGKIVAGMKIAKTLYTLATGFEIPAQKIFITPQGNVKRVPYMKYYPPQLGAAKHWLSVMFRDIWAETTTTNLQINGDFVHKTINELDINQLSPQQQELLLELNMKQISDAQHN